GGLHRYTVGQRRGLGVAMGTRYFVTKLDPKNGRVVLGPEEDLMVDRFFVSHLRFHSHTRRTCPTEGLSVKGRNRGNGVPCRVLFEDGGATVIPSQPVRRLACGQSACFYQGDLLLFGGVITEKKQKNHMCNM
ncbi:MAG: hypothetical protein IJ977_07705, partial [Fibrobacter sp.]|nr:hypothetical protein [Fibrobacter sp.]